MTVTTTYAPVTATGDGATVAFAFPYLVYQSSHLTITIDGVATSAWSAATYGSASGVTVTFDTAPADQSAIIIKRIVPYTQDTDLENFDGNPADVTEKQFDLLAMADQQIGEESDRAVIVPVGTSLTTNEITGTIDTTVRVVTITTAGPAASELSSVGATLDTSFTSLTTNDLLKYDGANWINVTIASLGFQTQDAILDDLAGLTQATDKIPYFDSATTAALLDFSDDDTLSGDSATAVVSEQAVKAYVDAITDNYVQHVTGTNTTMSTYTTQMVNDDTIPQNTEGGEIVTVAITPTDAANTLKIRARATFASSVTAQFVAAIFQDSTADALVASGIFINTANGIYTVVVDYEMAAGTVSETTFKLRGGCTSAGTITLNGFSGARKYGGVASCSITVTEVSA